MSIRVSRVLLGIGIAATCGVLIFGVMVWQSVTVERASADEARDRFLSVRSKFAGAQPILRVDPDGRVVRNKEPSAQASTPKYLRVLAYQVPGRRLAQANVPFWFVRVKGPAVKYSVRGTGFDFERLGIAAEDLARYGPSLVFDETDADGGRLLIWTE